MPLSSSLTHASAALSHDPAPRTYHAPSHQLAPRAVQSCLCVATVACAGLTLGIILYNASQIDFLPDPER